MGSAPLRGSPTGPSTRSPRGGCPEHAQRLALVKSPKRGMLRIARSLRGLSSSAVCCCERVGGGGAMGSRPAIATASVDVRVGINEDRVTATRA